jgi:hypothetical protein
VSRRAKIVVLTAAAGLLFAGCGGSSGQSPAAAKQEITTTWEAFFNMGKGSLSQLENGQQLQAVYQKNLQNPLAKQATAKVHDVTLLSTADCNANGVPSPCAQVTYDIVINGQPALAGSKGYATKQNGAWKVSKTTFCALVALGNNNQPPPGC